jgi:hypothetical protein
MSSSPPKKGEAEAVEGDQTSPENSSKEQQDVPMDPLDTQGHDIEVKEQDRWLPIANGMCLLIAPDSWHSDLRAAATGTHNFYFLHSSFDAVTCFATRPTQPQRRLRDTLSAARASRLAERSAPTYHFSSLSFSLVSIGAPGRHVRCRTCPQRSYLQPAAQQSCLPHQPSPLSLSLPRSSMQISLLRRVKANMMLTSVTLLQSPGL